MACVETNTKLSYIVSAWCLHDQQCGPSYFLKGVGEVRNTWSYHPIRGKGWQIRHEQGEYRNRKLELDGGSRVYSRDTVTHTCAFFHIYSDCFACCKVPIHCFCCPSDFEHYAMVSAPARTWISLGSCRQLCSTIITQVYTLASTVLETH